MQVKLTRNYMLTDEHAASSDGQPVLVHRPTGTAYGPRDIVNHPSLGPMAAGPAVEAMARDGKVTGADLEFVKKFTAYRV